MADVDDTLPEWSSTTASNKPTGATSIGTGLDDNIREVQGVVTRWLSHKGSDIASAATTDLGAVEGLMHDITGTATVTGFGTIRSGIWKVCKFEAAALLTHNATSLILPGGANIVTADGDVGVFMSEGSGNWRCLSYMKAGNQPGMTLQAAQATTSGTTKDFTIPAGAKKVTVMLNGVSHDGTEELIVQLGDSGGVETTGYSGTVVNDSGTLTAMSSGFLCVHSGAAAQLVHGSVTLCLTDASAHTWSASISTSDTAGPAVWNGAGTKDLDTVLTTVRLTTTGTPDDFDAGAVSVLVE